MLMKEGLLTTAEILTYLKINKITLYTLIKKKNLPAYKIGRLWRFKKDRLEKWLEAQEGKSRSKK